MGSHNPLYPNHESDIPSPWPYPLVREGTPTRAWTPGGRGLGDHLESPSAAMRKMYPCCQ